MKKAQIWALDLAIGLMVFIGIVFMFYRYSVSFVPEQTTLQRMIKQSGLVSNILLSEGYPENWPEKEIGNVRAFGLLTNEKLNESKWKKFCEWNITYYDQIREKLGTDFAFYVYFDKDSDGQREEIEGCKYAGKPVPEGATQVVKIERLVAYYNGTQIIPMKMILFLWSYSES